MKLGKQSLAKLVLKAVQDLHQNSLPTYVTWEMLSHEQIEDLYRAIDTVQMENISSTGWAYQQTTRGWMHCLFSVYYSGLEKRISCFETLTIEQHILHASFVKLVTVLSGHF